MLIKKHGHKLKLLTYMAPFSVNITRFSYG